MLPDSLEEQFDSLEQHDQVELLLSQMKSQAALPSPDRK